MVDELEKLADRLDELANKVMNQQDEHIRLKGLRNLLKRIKEQCGEVLAKRMKIPNHWRYDFYAWNYHGYIASYRLPFLYMALQNEERLLAEELALFGEVVEEEPPRPPKPRDTETTNEPPLSEREREYFGRAMEAGYMEPTETGYKWTFKPQASLAYFLNRICNPDGTSQTPYKKYEDLFSVKALAQKLYNLQGNRNIPKWCEKIDALFN